MSIEKNTEGSTPNKLLMKAVCADAAPYKSLKFEVQY